MRELIIMGLIALLLIGGCVWEISIWSECRQTNSFFYCVRILGR